MAIRQKITGAESIKTAVLARLIGDHYSDNFTFHERVSALIEDVCELYVAEYVAQSIECGSELSEEVNFGEAVAMLTDSLSHSVRGIQEGGLTELRHVR